VTRTGTDGTYVTEPLPPGAYVVLVEGKDNANLESSKPVSRIDTHTNNPPKQASSAGFRSSRANKLLVNANTRTRAALPSPSKARDQRIPMDDDFAS